MSDMNEKIESFMVDLDEVALMRVPNNEEYRMVRNIVENLLARNVFVEELPDGD